MVAIRAARRTCCIVGPPLRRPWPTRGGYTTNTVFGSRLEWAVCFRGQRRRPDAQHLAIEGQLLLEGPPNRLRASEPVPLPGEGNVDDTEPAPAQRRHHRLGLSGRHPAVVEALEEEQRGGDAVGRVQRRARDVQVATLRIAADQSLVVVRLELVRLAAERLEVPDPVIAGAGREDLVEGQRAENGESSGAPAPDQQRTRVGPPLCGGEARAGDAVLDVGDAPCPVEQAAVVAPLPAAPRA